MISDSGLYYIYRHIRLDTNKPFYIGWGKKLEEDEYKRSKSKNHRNSHWWNITNKTPFLIEILIESDNFDFILQKEKEFIKLYGRKDLGSGFLCNKTDGGEGTIGAVRTKEWQDKIVASNKKIVNRKSPGPCSLEKRIKLRNSNLGVKRSEITKQRVKLARAKQDISHLGKPVIQMDLQGNFIKEWESMAEANRVLKTGYNIRRAIIGNLTCKGFKWKYK